MLSTYLKANLKLVGVFFLAMFVFMSLQIDANAAIDGHLDLTSPDGGEVYTEGDVVTITWDATSNIDSISLGYSHGVGSLNWIETGLPNTGSYVWTVDVGNNSKTDKWISITGYETGKGSLSDRSENPFTVYQSGTPTPVPTQEPTQDMGIEPRTTIANLNRFPDVKTDETFFEFIEVLAEEEVVSGYSNGNFGPRDNVERQHLAKFIKNGFDVPTDLSCGGFPDVPKTNKFYEHITSLKCAGVISGYSNGEFKPSNGVTRAETMTFIVNAARDKKGSDSFLPKSGTNPFSDLPNDNVHADKILAGYSNDIVSGSNGKFDPDGQVSRGAVSKMIANTRIKLNLTEQSRIDYFVGLNGLSYKKVETSEYVFHIPSDFVFGSNLDDTLVYGSPNENSDGTRSVVSIFTVEVTPESSFTQSDCGEFSEGFSDGLGEDGASRLIKSELTERNGVKKCYSSHEYEKEGDIFMVELMASYRLNETKIYAEMAIYSNATSEDTKKHLQSTFDFTEIK